MKKLRKALFSLFILLLSQKAWGFFKVDWKDIKASVESKNYDKAINQLKKMKVKDSSLGSKHFSLGKIFLEKNEKHKASWHFKQYFFYDHIFSSYTYFYLGQIAFEQKKIKEARDFFLKSLKEEPNRFLKREIQLYLAKIDREEKKYLKAYRTLKVLERRWRGWTLYPDIIENLVFTQHKRNKSSSVCYWTQKLYTKYTDFEKIEFKDGFITLKGLDSKCPTSLKGQKKAYQKTSVGGSF